MKRVHCEHFFHEKIRLMNFILVVNFAECRILSLQDAISMITIIMSIGFSVDYSAHITYGYVVSPCSSPADRVVDALSALGWPLFQGGLSTILAVVVLADVPAYMIVTFFKTVTFST